MRDGSGGVILGRARLLILGFLAALGGCFLAFMLSASPASAAEQPHADPGILDGVTTTVTQAASQVEGQLTRVTDVVDHRRMPTLAPLRNLTHTATDAVVHLTAGLADTIDALPALELPGYELPLPQAEQGATMPDRLFGAMDPDPAEISITASTAHDRGAAIAATEMSGIPSAPPSSPYGDPAVPPRASMTVNSSSTGTNGANTVAATSDNAWMPLPSTRATGSQNEALPPSPGEGSDPTPD